VATIDRNLTLDLFAGVTEDFPFTIELYASDGVSFAALAAEDVVHCVLSERVGGEPDTELLDIASDQEASGESRIYVTDLGDAIDGDPALGYVRFAQVDTDAIVDDWDDEVRSKHLMCELYFIDASEINPANAKKIFWVGIIHLHRSGAQ
jgi:hypothetical protein